MFVLREYSVNDAGLEVVRWGREAGLSLIRSFRHFKVSLNPKLEIFFFPPFENFCYTKNLSRSPGRDAEICTKLLPRSAEGFIWKEKFCLGFEAVFAIIMPQNKTFQVQTGIWGWNLTLWEEFRTGALRTQPALTYFSLPAYSLSFPPHPLIFIFFFCSGDRIGRAYQGWLFPSLLLLCVTKPTATSEPCKTEIIINKSETIINTKNWSTKVRSRKAECLTLSASCLKTNRLIFRIHVHSLSNCNEVTSLVWDIDLTVRVRCHRHLNSAGWATWV